MSRHTKETKKAKQKAKLQGIFSEEKIKFDVLELLKTERQDSKPNLGKFLKDYVSEIRIYNSNKIIVYPEFRYEICKVFVRFFDGHELIKDYHANKSPEFQTTEFFLYDSCNEVELKKNELLIIEQFFSYLEQFKFVY